MQLGRGWQVICDWWLLFAFAFCEEPVDVFLCHEWFFVGWLLGGMVGLVGVDGFVEFC